MIPLVAFLCQAQCIVLSSDQYKVYVLQPVEHSALEDQRVVYQRIRSQCKTQARELGFNSGAVLVNSLSFAAAKDEIHESSSSSSSNTNKSTARAGFSSTHIGKMKSGPRRTKLKNVSVVTGYASLSQSNSSHSSSSYSFNEDKRSLDVTIDFANPKTNCEVDPNQPENQTPEYYGDLPLKG